MSEELEKLEIENAELKRKLSEVIVHESEIIEIPQEEVPIEPEKEEIVPEKIEEIVESIEEVIPKANKNVEKFDELEIEVLKPEDVDLIKNNILKKVIEKNPELENAQYIGRIQDALRELREWETLTKNERYFIQSLIVDDVKAKAILKKINPEHPIFATEKLLNEGKIEQARLFAIESYGKE
jgi:hypothetical protein